MPPLRPVPTPGASQPWSPKPASCCPSGPAWGYPHHHPPLCGCTLGGWLGVHATLKADPLLGTGGAFGRVRSGMGSKGGEGACRPLGAGLLRSLLVGPSLADALLPRPGPGVETVGWPSVGPLNRPVHCLGYRAATTRAQPHGMHGARVKSSASTDTCETSSREGSVGLPGRP